MVTVSFLIAIISWLLPLLITLRKIAEEFGEEYDLAFANGGDQDNESIPESPVCEEVGIVLIDGLGDKIQSSSWLLRD